MLTHKIRDMPQHMFGSSTSRSQSSESAQSYGSSYYPSKDYNQKTVSTEQIIHHDTIATTGGSDEKSIIDHESMIDDDIQKEPISYKNYHKINTNLDHDNSHRNNQQKTNINPMQNISSMPSKFKLSDIS